MLDVFGSPVTPIQVQQPLVPTCSNMRARAKIGRARARIRPRARVRARMIGGGEGRGYLHKKGEPQK